MKKIREIFLNIILLLFVFSFSAGVDYPNSDNQRYYLEHSSDINTVENELSHHTDSSDEDQMDQSRIMLLQARSECQKFIITSLPLPDNIFVSVWQPPKVF